MSTPNKLKQQIDSIVCYLVEIGLATDQNYAFYRQLREGRSEVTFANNNPNLAFKNFSYTEIYKNFKKQRAYTVHMADGALFQLSYQFNNKKLEKHRLAFFPSPYLDDFQNDPEIYLEDILHAHVVSRNIVPFPLRFDFDDQEDAFQAVQHPKSHLTLGQYKNCRIPVTAPLMPAHFVDFILRNFYHTDSAKYAENLPQFNDSFSESIFQVERSVIHLHMPIKK